jgi:hypothetical protein
MPHFLANASPVSFLAHIIDLGELTPTGSGALISAKGKQDLAQSQP